MTAALLAMRLVLGAWLALYGASHFLGGFMPVPVPVQPLAAQLLGAVIRSGLVDVVMGIQLGAGLLLIAGLFVPLALCVAMPLSVCAAFWAVVLEQSLPLALLTLAALALNGLLMLAHLDAYKGALQPRALTFGESDADGQCYEKSFAFPVGGVSPGQFALALLPLIAAFAFYHQFIFGPYKTMGYMVLAIPSAVLLLRLAQGLMRRQS